MTQTLADFLQQYGMYAALASIAINIVATIVGVFPTFIITAANILVFGFWTGTFVSFLGESLGAIVAFMLYRKGFRRQAQNVLLQYPRAQALINAQGREAFQLILLLRLLPFAPAWVSTLGAAVGKASLVLFATASTIGKIPALLIEAYAVYEVSQLSGIGKILMVFLAAWLAYDVWKRIKARRSSPE